MGKNSSIHPFPFDTADRPTNSIEEDYNENVRLNANSHRAKVFDLFMSDDETGLFATIRERNF